ncbi:MAG TPA: hypothetical protein VEI94_09615 [Candidatus Bathyarchaeia archaeon]|nr:hypothetical protein [Candidatus Bathyarchaeia archaeon]
MRVIVGLARKALPEGALDTEEKREAQRLAIAATRDALLEELAGTKFKVIRTYGTIPFVALEAGPDALEVLERSGNVVSVEEDRVAGLNPRR